MSVDLQHTFSIDNNKRSLDKSQRKCYVHCFSVKDYSEESAGLGLANIDCRLSTHTRTYSTC